MHNVLFLMTTAVAALAGADDALEPWSSNTQPTEHRRST